MKNYFNKILVLFVVLLMTAGFAAADIVVNEIMQNPSAVVMQKVNGLSCIIQMVQMLILMVGY